MSKKLLICTESYPYKGASENWLDNEIKHFSSRYSTIDIICWNVPEAHTNRKLPAQCTLHNIADYEGPNQNSGFKLILCFLRVLLIELFQSKRSVLYILTKPFWKSYFKDCFNKANQLESFLTVHNYSEKDNYYSVWMFNWSMVFAILSLNRKIFFTGHYHGYDLFPDRWGLKEIPFTNFVLKQCSKAIVMSKAGYEFLLGKYPKYSHKLRQVYAGTLALKRANFEPQQKVHLVSCSRVDKLKGVHDIVEILRNVKKDVEWNHFGAGPELENVKKLSEKLPANVKVTFHGETENAIILNYYQNHYVDFFIQLSKSEGLGLGAVEALSAGIPCISLDVGGVSEVVNSKTGHLFKLEENWKDKIVDIIENIDNSVFRNADFRSSVVQYWKNNFSAEVNYSKYYEIISSTK